MFKGNPEWSVFAIEASLDDVTKELLKLRHSKLIRQNVSIRLRRKTDFGANLAVVVKLRDNPWIIVLRSLGNVPADVLATTRRDAETISKRLKTRLITFFAEDTSGFLNYTIYESGKVLERAEWDLIGEKSVLRSRRKPRPKGKMKGVAFADAVFSDLGIYLPACYPRRTANACWLLAEKSSFSAIERAHVLEIRAEEEKLLELYAAALVKGDKRAAKRLGII